MMNRSHRVLHLIAVPFALFVVTGSLALVGWLGERERLESRRGFLTMAETNAGFVRRSHLPASPKLAANLSEILETDVVFREEGDVVIPPASGVGYDLSAVGELRETGVTRDIGGGREAVAFPLGPGVEAVFIRQSPGVLANLARGSTLLPLLVFWVLSLLLAFFISRNLVRPIYALARGASKLDPDGLPLEPFPGSERQDEIGHLARTLTETHGRLRDEIRRREESEKLALLGKMATGLAHEIRNPVAAVRMHAQLLLESGADPATAGLIVEEADVIENLVTQWMFLARPKPPEVGNHDLADIVGRALGALRARMEHAGVSCEVRIADGTACAVDASRVSQAVRNLVANAIQAMPDGGDLVVAGGPSDGRVELAVTDSGRGFSAEALERFGELFYSTKEGGMGVGLTVASEIARAHGGGLRVTNIAGGGASVTLSLPAGPDGPRRTPAL